jgi:UPF0176 protein
MGYTESVTDVDVAAFYKFFALKGIDTIRAELHAALAQLNTRGTVLLAPEGVNGTIAGTQIPAALEHVMRLTGCGALEIKRSKVPKIPFNRLHVKLKREIVTLGAPEVDPTKRVGAYVEARDWNALLADPDVVVIDTRNHYETRIGTFEGAIDPQTQAFGELKTFVREKLKDMPRSKKVAMFCTGGIRCEKATSLMLAEGFEQVYHLRGGILSYLEQVPVEESKWRGGCFVFDHRVAVTHGVVPSGHTMCQACGAPLDEMDLRHDAYVFEKSCGFCAG